MEQEIEEETPFIAVADSPELDSSDDGDEASNKTKLYLVKNAAARGKQRRYVVWGAVAVFGVLILVSIFCAGIAIGHFTAKGCNGEQEPSPSPTSATTPSSSSHNTTTKQDICDNPPVLLISLDGFWNGYFERNVTPNLSTIGSEGVRAQFVRSVFPTSTFPNHFTIVTGLYPDSHGIVDNNFYDKVLMEQYKISDNDPKWWLGEPVWVTARNQGLKSGTYFWPGSEVPGMRPTYYKVFQSSIPFEERVQTILQWLDYPSTDRPQILTLYLNEPDSSGHSYGPDSIQVEAALGRVDEALTGLVVELKERGIYDCVNIIIVSDHGMTPFNQSKLFYIPPHIPDGYNVSYSNYGVNMNINVKDGDPVAVQAVYESIQNISDPPFQVFYREDLPLRLHAGRHNPQRYGDIVVLGDLGSYTTYKVNSRPPHGEHGYDNMEVDMQSIFVARGPAFKEDYISPGFDNIQIYNLLCVEAREGVEGVAVECPAPDDPTSQCETCFCPHNCQTDQHSSEIVSDTNKVRMSQSMHLPLGVPGGGQGGGACLLTNNHSVTLYSTILHIPLWVAFTLTTEMYLQSPGGDEGCYQQDPRIQQVHDCTGYNTSLSNYTLSHLAPSVGGVYLPLISNSLPQLSEFYHRVWSVWEQQLMHWTAVYGTLHVITGPLLDSDHDGIRDTQYNQWLSRSGSIAIPSGFYSIVSRCMETVTSDPCPAARVEVLGILLPHKQPPVGSDTSDIQALLQFHLSTVADIESVTDISFFPGITPEQQARLKLQIAAMWQ